MILGPLKVFWFGKWRIRKLRQVKYYNRVKWLLDEGCKKEDVKKVLTLEKVETLRQKLNIEGVRGMRRNRALANKKRQIREALKAHGL